MMRLMTACLLSATFASIMTTWLLSSPGLTSAIGQVEVENSSTRQKRPETNSAQLRMTNEESVNVTVYEKVNKSVVNITTKAQATGLFFRNMPSEGAGSGMIIDQEGHVLTNYHVIEDANQVEVNLFDGSSHEATLVGADPVNDIAVLKITADADILHPVYLADSGQLKVGMIVFTIGNPFGLDRTMTTGIISSLNRTLQVRGNRTIKSIIQIDAAVNPGNSGGPLLDTKGQLIGMNTAIASKNGQNAGIGFAIPSNLIARVVPQLLKFGRAIRPEIGIQHVFETEAGLLIETVTPKGPADKAGLRGPKSVSKRRGPFSIERMDRSVADLIVGIDGEEIKTVDDFLSYIETKRPGDRVIVEVLREGKTVMVPVLLSGSKN